MARLTADQFAAITRYKYGLGPRPKGVPPIRKGGDYQYVLDRWAAFDRWYAWRKKGGPKSKGVWRKVPGWDSPKFSPWVLAKEVGRKEHANPLPLAFKTVASKTLGKNGLYFYNYTASQIPEARLIQLCQEHGLWVALLVHELDRAPIPAFDTQAQRERLQSAGITVVASGWVEAEHDHHAQAQAAAQFSHGFDEYLMNAEYSWSYPQPGFMAMDEFAPVLRAHLGPTMPLSLSPMWGQQTHMAPLLKVGLSCVRPQCYQNEWPHETPASAIRLLEQPQHDLPAGLPAQMIDPCYGKYGGYQMTMPEYAPYHVEAQKSGGARGASAWSAENLDEANVLALARF